MWWHSFWIDSKIFSRRRARTKLRHVGIWKNANNEITCTFYSYLDSLNSTSISSASLLKLTCLMWRLVSNWQDLFESCNHISYSSNCIIVGYQFAWIHFQIDRLFKNSSRKLSWCLINKFLSKRLYNWRKINLISYN